MDQLVQALLESEDLVREQIEQILGPRPFLASKETDSPVEPVSETG
jgi:hypothetical protein